MLKLLANLTDPRDGDAMDKIINALSRVAPDGVIVGGGRADHVGTSRIIRHYPIRSKAGTRGYRCDQAKDR